MNKVIYDYSDIQGFICDELGISDKDYRNYHNIVGGSYKDLWHVWYSFNEDISNDSVHVTYMGDLTDIFEQLIERHGEWVEVLIPVYQKLVDELGDSFSVHYSW